jgi:tetratricopeptide (TPR) repeat protein
LADFADSIRLDPQCAVTYNNRGYAYLKRGQYEPALSDLQKAIELDRKHPNAYKNLAWLMATCPEAQYRDGAKAVEHAKRALELGGQKNAAWLDVLAAAYAESGQFLEAIDWEKKALAVAGNSQDATEYGQRLDLYREGKAYRQVSTQVKKPASQ